MSTKTEANLLKSEKNFLGRGEEAEADLLGKNGLGEAPHLLREHEKVKENPLQLKGKDFDRSFPFPAKYPDSKQAGDIISEMNDIESEQIAGPSYESFVKILSQMPAHPVTKDTTAALKNIEREEIDLLSSDIIMSILKLMPDHHLARYMAQVIVEKNLTSSYEFISANQLHPQTKTMIVRMFKKDPNIAILLLQERMDHPQVDVIIDCVYSLSASDVQNLTPNAIIFILEIAADHQHAEKLFECLVEQNYIKAFQFVKRHKDCLNADMMVRTILKRKPELEELFNLA